MISTPDRTLIDAQSAFAGRNVARIGTHFYPLICPLGHQLYLKWELYQVTVMPPYMYGQGVDSRLRGNDGFTVRSK